MVARAQAPATLNELPQAQEEGFRYSQRAYNPRASATSGRFTRTEVARSPYSSYQPQEAPGYSDYDYNYDTPSESTGLASMMDAPTSAVDSRGYDNYEYDFANTDPMGIPESRATDTITSAIGGKFVDAGNQAVKNMAMGSLAGLGKDYGYGPLASAAMGGAAASFMAPMGLISMGGGLANELAGGYVSDRAVAGIEDEGMREQARSAYGNRGLLGHGVYGSGLASMFGHEDDPALATEAFSAADRANQANVAKDPEISRFTHHARMTGQQHADKARTPSTLGRAYGLASAFLDPVSTFGGMAIDAANEYNAEWDKANPGYARWGVNPDGTAMSRGDFLAATAGKHPGVAQGLMAEANPTLGDWIAEQDNPGGLTGPSLDSLAARGEEEGRGRGRGHYGGNDNDSGGGFGDFGGDLGGFGDSPGAGLI